MSGLPPEQEARIRQIAQSGRMIEAIKEYRLLTNAGLAESKAAVEALRFGAGASASATQPPTAIDSSRRQQILDLMAQDKKIEAIKLFRGWTGADLKQAKDAVEALERGGTVHIPEAAAPVKTEGALDDQIRALLAKKRKLEAIKVHRLATNAGLKEAKDYVEAIEAQMPDNSLSQSSVGDDPFAEENSRTRRMLVMAFLLVVIVAALAFFFFRNGL